MTHRVWTPPYLEMSVPTAGPRFTRRSKTEACCRSGPRPIDVYVKEAAHVPCMLATAALIVVARLGRRTGRARHQEAAWDGWRRGNVFDDPDATTRCRKG